MFTPPVGSRNHSNFRFGLESGPPESAQTPNMTPVQILTEAHPWSVHTPTIPLTNEKNSRCFTVEKRTEEKPPFGFITPDLATHTTYHVRYYKRKEVETTTPVGRGVKDQKEPIQEELEDTSVSLDEIYQYLRTFEEFNPEIMLNDCKKDRAQTKAWLDTFTAAIPEVDDVMIKYKYTKLLEDVQKRLKHSKLEGYFD